MPRWYWKTGIKVLLVWNTPIGLRYHMAQSGHKFTKNCVNCIDYLKRPFLLDFQIVRDIFRFNIAQSLWIYCSAIYNIIIIEPAVGRILDSVYWMFILCDIAAQDPSSWLLWGRMCTFLVYIVYLKIYTRDLHMRTHRRSQLLGSCELQYWGIYLLNCPYYAIL